MKWVRHIVLGNHEMHTKLLFENFKGTMRWIQKISWKTRKENNVGDLDKDGRTVFKYTLEK
jgi:ribosomal protein L1